MAPKAMATDEPLHASREGLSAAEASARLRRFGPNELPEPRRRSYLSIFLRQLLSPLIYLLLAATLVAFLVGESKDALVILVVVILNAAIGTLQEGRAEQSLASLRKLSGARARVRRDGRELEIAARELVPGDLILLAAGDAIPADARLLEASSFSAAEAAISGESLPVPKSAAPDAPPEERRIFAGCFATSGRALALVTETGEAAQLGQIARLATTTKAPKTQLERRIEQFGRSIVIASLLLLLLVIGAGLARGMPFPSIFLIAISQMVSLIPEGLPVAITIALAVGVQRMASRRSIVRRLSAVETLGATTVICTDKTGTLTRNEMTVTELALPGARRILLTGSGYAPKGELREQGRIVEAVGDEPLLRLLEAMLLCNDARLLPPKTEDGEWTILGDPTEGALITAAEKAGLSAELLRARFPRQAEVPFDSARKLMATELLHEGRALLILKGAPEAIFPLCTGPDLPRWEEEARRMAGDALRVLAFASAGGLHIHGEEGLDAMQGRLRLLGLAGELDPPRPEVASALASCRAAGIRTVMVTGDHKHTGAAIARALGIGREGDLVLDGGDLGRLGDSELEARITGVSVFARVQPAQKLRIVRALQKKGEVVAMTGDGVNDAPALVQADVGVAMGRSGTEVAKEAAKIVVTDDNFSTIVDAIAEGRLVYQNIRKLILFLFVTSIDEVLLLLLALFTGHPAPLAAVQILWINLASEGALTINLIMEPPEGSEMRRPPTPPRQPLLDRPLYLRMPWMILPSLASSFGWFLVRGAQGVPFPLLQTETFTVLVVSQWFNVLNCRSETRSALSLDLLRNPWLLGGLLLANALHALVIYWEPMASFFHTVPIAAPQVLGIGLVASLVLWVEELRKWLARRAGRSA